MLHDVNASISAGRVTGLFGRSGSRKSRLMRAIAGGQSKVGGTVTVLGERPGSMAVGRALAYMTLSYAVDGMHHLSRGVGAVGAVDCRHRDRARLRCGGAGVGAATLRRRSA